MSRQVDVEILPHQAEPFRLIMLGERVTITLAWGRGLGKSFFARLIIWILIAQWFGKRRKTRNGWMTGIRIYMLMPTLKQFKQVHGALLQAENEGQWSFLGGKLDRTDYSLRFPDGSFFVPVPAAVATSERGRGFRGDVTLIDEGDDIDPAVRHAVARPWFTEPWSLGIELVMGTPKRGRYGLLFELFQRGKSDDPELDAYHSFRVKSEECPDIVSPKVLADAKREYPQTYAREYEADFDSAEGLVYPFDEDFHVCVAEADIEFFTDDVQATENAAGNDSVTGACCGQNADGCAILRIDQNWQRIARAAVQIDRSDSERVVGADGSCNRVQCDRVVESGRTGRGGGRDQFERLQPNGLAVEHIGVANVEVRCSCAECRLSSNPKHAGADGWVGRHIERSLFRVAKLPLLAYHGLAVAIEPDFLVHAGGVSCLRG